MKYFRSTKGFTIIELLVVITIMAMITGIGIAVLSHSGRQFGFQATRGEIVSLFRYTRSNAMAEKGETTVVIDAGKKQVYSCARRTLGLWHFEDVNNNLSTGAFGNNAQLQGDANIAPYGRFGNGLMITNTGYAICGTIPVVSRDQGIAVECWISPTNSASFTERTPIDLTNGDITLNPDDSIRIKYGSLTTDTASATIPYERWSYVSMIYAPDYIGSGGSGTLSLYINNTLIGQITGTPNAPLGKWNFNVSDSANPFKGMIDEVKVSLVSETERLQLEPDVSVQVDYGTGFTTPTNPILIKFDKNGNLTQSAPLIKLTSSSTKDSFILEVTSWGGVKIR
ncbi:MAG: LamG-like jellyroll fold domain-containing protein [Planctomycetota bacterium]